MLLNSAKSPFLLSVALFSALIATTAWQGYAFWQGESVAGGGSQSSGQIVVQETRKVPEVSLSSLPLFGEERIGEQAPVEEDIDNLPETNLRLTLRGVMAASGDFPGSALVEDDKRQTEAYLVGEELPGRARLKAVRPDRIIIDRGGKLENLYFPEEDDQEGLSVAANQQEQSAADDQPTYAEPGAQSASYPGPEANSASSDERREEIRKRLEQLRNRLRNNN